MTRVEDYAGGYIDTDVEVAENAIAALLYITDGDSTYAPYDLRGLCVFAVIGALREHDETFYGESSTLDELQRQRLAEVESVIDVAVENKMHYFPFGHIASKTEIDHDDQDDQQRHGERSGSLVPIPSHTNKGTAAHRRYFNREQTAKANVSHPEPGPVTITKIG